MLSHRIKLILLKNNSYKNSGIFSFQIPALFSSIKINPLPMPSLSPTMTHGTISSWKKSPGDKLQAGDILCEIETDKASVGFEVQDEGVLAKILVAANSPEMKCGEPIALIVEDLEAYQIFVGLPDVDKIPPPSSNSSNTINKSTISIPSPSLDGVVSTPVISFGPLKFSPAARHLVESRSLSTQGLVGTAKGGRISKADVILALQSGQTKPVVTNLKSTITSNTSSASAATAVSTPISATSTSSLIPLHITSSSISYTPSTEPVNDKFEDIPNSNMRKIIAKRLTESKVTVPHFYSSIECEIDSLMSLRKKLKKDFDTNVSVNDLVIKAAACALRDLPRINSKWSVKEGKVMTEGNTLVAISVAVATPNGLITPIVNNADRLGLAEINAKVKDLATRARDGKLKPEEFQGGSYSISNLGMYAIGSFSAVINPPQACILAVGAGISRVLPPKDQSKRPRMGTAVTVQMSCDRRVVSEMQAGEYLQVLRQYLSEPQNLLL